MTYASIGEIPLNNTRTRKRPDGQNGRPARARPPQLDPARGGDEIDGLDRLARLIGCLIHRTPGRLTMTMGRTTTTALGAAILAISATDYGVVSAFSPLGRGTTAAPRRAARQAMPNMAASTGMSARSSSFTSTTSASTTARQMTSTATEDMFDTSSLLTPEGYGFSSSAERILKKAKRSNNGYYKASASDRVIDVMAGIADRDAADVALVFDDEDALLGIFTDTDYIKVCTARKY